MRNKKNGWEDGKVVINSNFLNAIKHTNVTAHTNL